MVAGNIHCPSCNFPVLLMAMFWKGTTTRGVLAGGFLGLISARTIVVICCTVDTAEVPPWEPGSFARDSGKSLLRKVFPQIHLRASDRKFATVE